MFIFKSARHDYVLSASCDEIKCVKLMRKVGSRAFDDGWHTLIRGLVTAFPYVRLGLPLSNIGHRLFRSAT